MEQVLGHTDPRAGVGGAARRCALGRPHASARGRAPDQRDRASAHRSRGHRAQCTPGPLEERFLNPRAIELVLRLGRALQELDTPAHRLESALGEACRRLRLDGQFFSTPTSLFAAFGQGAEQKITLVRIERVGGPDLERMTEIDRMADLLEPSAVGLDAAEARLDEIQGAPPLWSARAGVFASAAVSFAVSLFFGGGWPEMIAGGLFGGVVGLMGLLLARYPAGGRVYELAAAFTVAAACGLLGRAGLVSTPAIPTLAAIIILVPGMTLTVAMSEISTRHLASGSARLTAAAVALVQLAFGTAIGRQLVGAAPGPELFPPPPWWLVHPCVLISGVGLAVLFRVPHRFVLWSVVGTHLAFWSSRLGADAVGPELGTALGAFVVCATGNLFARLARAPSAVVIIPGILLLVPGSIGFQSLVMFFERDAISGVARAFDMIVIASAVVLGLLTANAAIPPRRSL